MFADKEQNFNGIETLTTVRDHKYVRLEADFFH